MKRRDQTAQFACAWMADDRQILAYLWDKDDQYHIMHMSQDPEIRLCFALDFKTADDAWHYFHSIRTSAEGVRMKIENVFEGLFEQMGKEYESEDDKGGPPLED